MESNGIDWQHVADVIHYERQRQMTARQMGTFWASRQTGATYFSKEALSKHQIPFTIESVNRVTSQNYGPQWNVQIRLDSEDNSFTVGSDGETVGIISFGAAQYRDDFMRDLQQALIEGETVRAIVTQFNSKTGREGFTLSPEPSNDVQQSLDMGDDVPF